MDEIIKITPDFKRAKALKDLAINRYKTISSLKESYRVLEEYYEIIKELLTAIMYEQGLKTLSHKTLVEYAAKSVKYLSGSEVRLIDELRIKRNSIVYYGENVTEEFIKSREKAIKEIIGKLIYRK